MARSPDTTALDAARKRAGLSVDQLWLRYFELGGTADPIELEGFLHGLLRPHRYQYNLIVHALNEHFMEAGQGHPLPYASNHNH